MTTDNDPGQRGGGKGPRRGMVLAASAVAVLLAAAAIYGMGFAAGNGEAAACEIGEARLEAIAEAARGEVAGVIVPEEAEALPEMSFVDADGTARTLSEWRGKVVLLNLWATWCAPCREEMPALDALQAEMGGDDFEVVTVSLDRGDAEKPTKFLQETGIENLDLYRDPENDTFSTLKSRGRAFGLPTTLLIDRDGCEIGHLPGPADWASEDAKGLVGAALGRAPSG